MELSEPLLAVLLILKSSLCAAYVSPKIPAKGLQTGAIEAGFSVYSAAIYPGAKTDCV